MFPFGFRGEAFSGPFCVGFGVLQCDADNGMVAFVFDGGFFAEGVAPVGVLFPGPPGECG